MDLIINCQKLGLISGFFKSFGLLDEKVLG